jgi:acyl-CoA reductase-like NAD-dependent aldehyde dehydrogenase
MSHPTTDAPKQRDQRDQRDQPTQRDQADQRARSDRDRDQDTQAPPPPERYDTTRLPIAGVWRDGRAGSTLTDTNPYNGETLVEIKSANPQDVDDAYSAAQRIQKGWAAVSPQVRHTLFEHAALIMQIRRREIIDWLITESGSTVAKATFEWELTYEEMIESAGHTTRAEGYMLPSSVRGKDSHVYRDPVGVVGVISPWNFPLHLSMRSVAPAIALGNTVVLKPASDTPVTGGLLIARIFEEAGLPLEVLSVIVGHGDEIGDAVMNHPTPRVISFTGSTAVGRHVGELAGRNVKRVCLELGGNCPLVVLDDADVNRAVHAAIAGSFLHQGQICIRINRILVDDRIHDDFVDKFAERAVALTTGDPASPDTDLGPIINKAQFDSIMQKVDETVKRGANPRVTGTTKDLIIPAIVLDDVTNDMPAAHDEVFGPVAPIIRFSGDEEGLRLANDTEYGLSSAVFTHDLERGMQFAKRIDAGMTHINDWTVNVEANTAFGGEKASGIGRFGGQWAIDAFTTAHWISTQEIPRTYPL